jgi:hypothetical protein
VEVIVVSHEIWAAYSVRDHLEPGAFLADVVMYDKLVVPVPSDEPGERERWEKQWEPARQERLLVALGDRVRTVPWDAARRQRWGEAYDQNRKAAGGVLREGLQYWLTGSQILDAAPAMATRIAATTPYRSLDELTTDFGITEATPAPQLPGATVLAVVGHELLTPQDDSRDEFELLVEAVEATKSPDFRIARAALHDRLAGFTRGGVTDVESVRAAVADMNTQVEDMHRALQKRRIWTTARRVFSFGQIVIGALGAPLNPIALGLVVTGIGSWTATEHLSSSSDVVRAVPDVAMLLDVKNQLHL